MDRVGFHPLVAHHGVVEASGLGDGSLGRDVTCAALEDDGICLRIGQLVPFLHLRAVVAVSVPMVNTEAVGVIHTSL